MPRKLTLNLVEDRVSAKVGASNDFTQPAVSHVGKAEGGPMWDGIQAGKDLVE